MPGAELRASWQGRVLAHAEGKMGAVALSVIAENYDDVLLPLLQAVFPGFRGVPLPAFCSAAKVAKTGHVCADLITKHGERIQMFAIFRSTKQMEGQFRRLADRLKLTDADRTEMFAAVKKWVVADYRLDPNMDYRDPDARRLVLN